MLWPFLRNLLVSLVRRAKPYALPLSAGVVLLASSVCLAVFWFVAWFSPSAVAYTGNGRVALAAGVFQLWAVASVVLTARQPPVQATTLRHPVVFTGAFWLLAGHAVAFLVAATLGGFYMYAFSVASMLWAGLFALAFPRTASDPKGEIVLLFAPFTGTALLLSLAVFFAIVGFFQLTWLVQSEHPAALVLFFAIMAVLLMASGAFAYTLLEALEGMAFYAPLLLTKGHSTTDEVARLALAFSLQRYPTLLAENDDSMFDAKIRLSLSAYGTIQDVEAHFLYDLVKKQHGISEVDAFASALQDHLRRHARLSYLDMCRDAKNTGDGRSRIDLPLQDEIQACRRSKHAYLATLAAAGPAPVPATP